ncbi:hypothetical protein [Paenibacillus thalictri]|uniref:Uncharacterized protein n=1 Tax=Paenibacillus thalictri TaxID=2527873 RepID=A0A4Q9DME0_9BACL|nr:hypothetical protein [Paenibacillus thalictri]TBL74660.1 hypothetical protein EYB31_25430 [Paenibacillus thalictri]
MLNRSFTAVVERNVTLTENFITEPYETGWAKEARWFIRILDMTPGTSLHVRPQLSPDGLFWCDAECAGLTINGPGPGMVTLPTPDNFGHWLALKGAFIGSGDAEAPPSVKLIIYLALKE